MHARTVTFTRRVPILVVLAVLASLLPIRVALATAVQTLTVSSSVSLPEGDTGLTPFPFTVGLSPAGVPAVAAVNFTWHTVDGTATDGTHGPTYGNQDYIPVTSGTGTIPAGGSNATITVQVVGDVVPESDETFSVVVVDASDATDTATGTGTILNDDPKVSIADASVPEGTSASTDMIFTLTLTAPSKQDFTVNYATTDGTAKSPGDYQAVPSSPPSSVTVSAGLTTATVSVPIAANTTPTGTFGRQFTVTLSSISPPGAAFLGRATATGTIRPAAVSIGDVRQVVPKAFPTPFSFPVTLDHPVGTDTLLHYETADGTAAASDGDYNSQISAVTIPAGAVSAAISITVNVDSKEEPDEWFSVTVTVAPSSNVTISKGTGIGTIHNDNGPALSIANTSALEGNPPDNFGSASPSPTTSTTASPSPSASASPSPSPSASPSPNGATGTLSFVVTLDPPRTGSAVTVDYTTQDVTSVTDPNTTPAKAGTDYTPTSGTLTFPAGSTSQTVTVAIIPNTIAEPDKVMSVVLSNPKNAVIHDGYGVGLGTILNDDTPPNGTPPTARITGPSTGQEGEQLTFDGSTSTPAAGTIAEYAWAFSDGSPSQRGPQISKAFTTAGSVTVALRVTDNSGNIDITSVQVQISDGGIVERSAGADRIATAVAVSKDHFDKAGDAVLATASTYADGLAGGALAAGLSAPLLLTTSSAVPASVLAELTRLGVQRVWLLGGTAAISAKVQDQLTAAKYEVHRFAGKNRYDTAALVGVGLGTPTSGQVLLALGQSPDASRAWPDALSAGALTATLDIPPTLLTMGDALPPETERALAAMNAKTVTIVGGPSAISPHVEAQLTKLGYATERLAGNDRYQTSIAVAQRAYTMRPTDTVVFATGANFPDGLAATSLAAHLGALLVLVPPGTLGASKAIQTFLGDNAGCLDKAVVVGGTSVISDAELHELSAAITGTGCAMAQTSSPSPTPSASGSPSPSGSASPSPSGSASPSPSGSASPSPSASASPSPSPS